MKVVNTTEDSASAPTVVSMMARLLSTIPKSLGMNRALERSVRLGGFTWNPTQVIGTRFVEVDCPSVWELSSYVEDKLNYHAGWRGTICVEIRHNGTPYQYGQVVFCLDPTPHRSVAYSGDLAYGYKTNKCNSYYKALQHPFAVKVEPSTTDVKVIKLPWLDNYAFRYRGEGHQYAMLRAWVVAPLSKVDATTAQNVEFTINIWVEDAEMVVNRTQQSGEPDPPFVPPRPVEYVPTNIPASIPYELPRILQSGKGFSREGPTPTLPRGVTARDLIGTAAGFMADRMGLSRPMENGSTAMHRVTTTSSRTRMAGWISGFQASATGEASIDPSAAALGFGTDADADIANVANRWGLVGAANFLQTAARGDVVWQLPASPVQYMKVVDDDGVGGIAVPPMTFCALNFGGWRGKLKLCVEVIASPYHRGTLRIVHSPATSGTLGPGDYQAITVNQVVEIAGSKCVEFEIPWTAPLPILPTDALDGTYTTPNLTRLSSWLGYVALVVESPLISGNGGASASVQVNLYMKVDDFEGYGPDTAQLQHFVVSRVLQSGVGFMADTQKTVFGERVMSFNQLARRLTYGNSLRVTTDGGGAIAASAYAQHIFTRVPSMPPAQARYGYSAGTADAYVPFDIEPYMYTAQLVQNHMPVLCSAFLAMRGGSRVAIDVQPDCALGAKRSLAVGGIGDVAWGDKRLGVVNHLVLWEGANDKLNGNFVAWIKSRLGLGNTTSFDNTVDSVPTIEVPYNEFLPFRGAQWWPGTTRAAFNTDFNAVNLLTQLHFDPAAAITPTVDQLPRGVVYYGGADDFVLNQFMYCPILYDRQY